MLKSQVLTDNCRQKDNKNIKMLWFKIFWVFASHLPHKIAGGSSFGSDQFGVPSLQLDTLQLTLSKKILVDIFSPRGQTLKGYLGWLPRTSNVTYTNCSSAISMNSICIKYENNMTLIVAKDDTDHCEKNIMSCHAVLCHKIHWVEHTGGSMDCFLLGDESWYGGSEMISQRWPMQSHSQTWYPAVTGDPLHHPSGSIVENFWISSSGFAIFVEHTVPLFVNFNESGSGKLCFTTAKKHPYQNYKPEKAELTYSICAATSIKEAYTFSLHKWMPKPSDIPNDILFLYPIWSTWVRYKQNINDTAVLKFASEIKDMDFPASQIEIDDKWEDCHGNLNFDSLKFSDPAAIIDKLKSMGFLTTLWVHPFCNKECDMYKIGEKMGYWVKNKKGNISEVKWWNGRGAALDVTNEKAVVWFVERLQKLKTNFGIESFKFDAGEVLWLENDFIFHNSYTDPNIYSQIYAEIAARFGKRVEIRTGFNTQNLPLVVRMFDKFSLWDYENGLQTLIPSVLHLSLLGYFFILPDMVGGNNYDSQDQSLPDRELYIRWLEANIFLPFIQISITPWDYDDETIKISKKMLSIREKYSNYMLTVAQQTIITGEPIIKPIWWTAPDDIEALQIDSEFLLGDGILVAPVLAKGSSQRNIYLPDGKWNDIQNNKIYEGSQWLYNYKAPLNFLPFFIRHS